MKSHLMFIIGLVAITLQAAAQAPLQFNYQGVARNSGGAAIVSQLIGLRFSVRNGGASGTIQYSENRTATTDARGLFNVAIGGAGATGTTGSFAAISFSSGLIFLQIEIDVNNSGNFINMGAVQLLSVPYALYSNSAASSDYSANSGRAQTSFGSGIHFFDVSFSDGANERIPVNEWHPVVFDAIDLNESDAYTRESGVYTAREDGIYKFDVSLYTTGTSAVSGGLFKNEQLMKFFSPSLTNQSNSDGYYFNYTSMLRLAAGDKIYFAVRSNKDDTDAFIIRDLRALIPQTNSAVNSFSGYKIR